MLKQHAALLSGAAALALVGSVTIALAVDSPQEKAAQGQENYLTAVQIAFPDSPATDAEWLSLGRELCAGAEPTPWLARKALSGQSMAGIDTYVTITQKHLCPVV